MTTTVRVNAHCASNKEVIVTIKDPTSEEEVVILQDGEVFEKVVYDDREINVKEVVKA